MLNIHVQLTESRETTSQFFRHSHGTVLTTGAANCDGGVVLTLTAVALKHGAKSRKVVADELLGACVLQHVVAHRGVLTGQGAQLRNPVRVRDETHISHVVSVRRRTVLEAEAHHGQIQLLIRTLSKHFTHGTSQLVNVHTGGVNGAVRSEAQTFKESAFSADTVEDAALTLQRVRAALSLVAGNNGLVLGVKEEHGKVNIGLAQSLNRSGKIGEQCAGANVNAERHLRNSRTVTGHQLCQGTEHLRRDVIDNVPALILQYICDSAAACTGNTGNHQNLRTLLTLGGIYRGGLALILGHGASSPSTRNTLYAMIQDLYLTVRGYGQKFHQYDRNMRRSPDRTPEGTPEERNPHHKCLRIMLPKGSTEGDGRQSRAAELRRVQQSPHDTSLRKYRTGFEDM